MQLPDLDQLQQALGMRFRDPMLLRSALVHSSFINELPSSEFGSNERLEFLGDAVLGHLIAHKLYQAYPRLAEGELTVLRSHLVRTETLADVARRFGLGDYLLLGRGEEASGGRERPTNLARAFEALVGAVLLDSGFARARAFVRRCLRSELAALAKSAPVADYKSQLQRAVQAQWHQTPTYRLVAAEGPGHARTFQVVAELAGVPLGRGSGRSKKEAEQQAARIALAALGPSDQG